jgi:hypothetical protein
VPTGFGKNGCQPSPNANASSPAFSIARRALSVAPRASARNANACVARNGHGQARAPSPLASWSSAILAVVASAASVVHARCQPTPWIACGESPKFRASA